MRGVGTSTTPTPDSGLGTNKPTDSYMSLKNTDTFARINGIVLNFLKWSVPEYICYSFPIALKVIKSVQSRFSLASANEICQ